ncbi:MAG: hypothetical protein Q8874_02675 [Sweet potato little leaf phytoplasma]|nr:hypothetical protein [Sweet potato little leaf phytoplasma]
MRRRQFGFVDWIMTIAGIVTIDQIVVGSQNFASVGGREAKTCGEIN